MAPAVVAVVVWVVYEVGRGGALLAPCSAQQWRRPALPFPCTTHPVLSSQRWFTCRDSG